VLKSEVRTSNFGLRTSDFGLRTSFNFELQTSNFGLRTSDFNSWLFSQISSIFGSPSSLALRSSLFIVLPWLLSVLRTSDFGLRTSFGFGLRTSFGFGLRISFFALSACRLVVLSAASSSSSLGHPASLPQPLPCRSSPPASPAKTCSSIALRPAPLLKCARSRNGKRADGRSLQGSIQLPAAFRCNPGCRPPR